MQSVNWDSQGHPKYNLQTFLKLHDNKKKIEKTIWHVHLEHDIYLFNAVRKFNSYSIITTVVCCSTNISVVHEYYLCDLNLGFKTAMQLQTPFYDVKDFRNS